MIEEIYTSYGKDIKVRGCGGIWVIADSAHDAGIIVHKLNQLTAERNKLQFECNMEILRRQSLEKEIVQLNELYDENQKLKNANLDLHYKLLAILDFIKEKETVTHQEMKDFWNEMVREV